jgi:hypothetical protein
MSDKEVDVLVAQYADKYPPLILGREAAEIARVPLQTIYDWSSRQLLDDFKSKRGRHFLLRRDAFVRFIATGVCEENDEC